VLVRYVRVALRVCLSSVIQPIHVDRVQNRSKRARLRCQELRINIIKFLHAPESLAGAELIVADALELARAAADEQDAQGPSFF